MLAREVMTEEIVTVRPETTLRTAAKFLKSHGISAAPVAERDGTIVGVVAKGNTFSKMAKTVRSVMQRDFSSVTEDQSIEAVARAMMSRQLEVVPVLRGNRMVGTISQDDIISALAMGMQDAAARSPIYDL